MLRPALFLDRDGVIIEEAEYLADPNRLTLLPGVAEALRRAMAAGFALIVVTNQSGVARGLLTEDDLGEIHARLLQMLAAESVALERVYYCPHHPLFGRPEFRNHCECRKPKPGMLLRAAREQGLDPARSFMVGDKRSDLEAARAAGVTPLLVRTGYGGKTEAELACRPLPNVFVADNLGEAVTEILRQRCDPLAA